MGVQLREGEERAGLQPEKFERRSLRDGPLVKELGLDQILARKWTKLVNITLLLLFSELS